MIGQSPCYECRHLKERANIPGRYLCNHPVTKEARPLLDLRDEDNRQGRMGQRVKTSARELMGVDGPWSQQGPWRWPWAFKPGLTWECERGPNG